MVFLAHHAVSVLHVLSALVALGAGTGVLLGRKGTPCHRWLGWLYVGGMAGLLLTAFRIYSLFGSFGIVHWGAVGAGLALLLGVGAPLGRARVPAWQRWHYLGMGASLVGLYAALAAESSYRLFPMAYFWWSTLGPAGAVLVAGSLLLYWHYPAPPPAEAARAA